MSRDRRAKFVELAEKRVNKTLKDIELIGNLSSQTNYDYTDEDVQKIVRALEEALQRMKSRFGTGEEEEPLFKL